MGNRLYRSRKNYMIAGVCGGLGDYLGLDPTLIRVFFLILAITNGIGVFVYILFWFIVPWDDSPREASLGEVTRSSADEIADHARSVGEDLRKVVRNPNPQVGLYLGVALILLGAFYLLQNLHIPWLHWLDSNIIWPVLLIFGGLVLIVRRWRGD